MEIKEWTIVAIIVLIIVGFPTACTMDQNRKIAEASARGEDPVAIKCAMDGGITPVCIIKAATQKTGH